MIDRASFLAAIRLSPDDDGPRLAYADWLDAHGEEGRAEFIRLQLRIAALRATCRCSECVRMRSVGGGSGPCAVDLGLRQREREFLAGPAFVWFQFAGIGSVASGVNGLFGGWTILRRPDPSEHLAATIHRGFIHSVRGSLGLLLNHTPAIVRREPLAFVDANLDSDAFETCWLGVRLPAHCRIAWPSLSQTFVGDVPSGEPGHYEASRRKARAALSACVIARAYQVAASEDSCSARSAGGDLARAIREASAFRVR